MKHKMLIFTMRERKYGREREIKRGDRGRERERQFSHFLTEIENILVVFEVFALEFSAQTVRDQREMENEEKIKETKKKRVGDTEREGEREKVGERKCR